ncbi:hypothetical protein EPA93_29070 [Ktedonosporobacter rubrisoli]|uniref:WD40 repeat domain-containing protein n=1 Tax=Ktedonosporobacter rubrisoli TaxID=2509675 RepID=A0A4P6JW78_KTERU|nr:WD40 repeat domain-containing protein [Ktedonosporobacter rubrisoli]QBD79814.1 hypothetical protein EPA93_29070 [Ktedonosporobacter rubrisoli]
MSPLPIFCPRCGSSNDQGVEYCHQCKHSLHSETSKSAEMPPLLQPGAAQSSARDKPGQPSPTQRVHRLSRRIALWGIAGGTMALSGLAVTGYLLQQSRLDPHILAFAADTHVASWSPDGTRVASVSWADGETPDPLSNLQSGNVVVQVWNAATGKHLLTCRLEHAGTSVAPVGVVWSASGKQLVAFVQHYGQGTPGSRIVDLVQVWDAATGQRLRTLPVTPPVTLTEQGYWPPDQLEVDAWALNAGYLAMVKKRWDSAFGKGYQDIEIWDIVAGRKVSTLDPGNQIVQNLVWAPESRKLAVSGSKLCQLWDAPAGKKLHVFPTHPIVAWSLDERSLAVGNTIYDVQTGRRITDYRVAGRLIGQAWSPDGKRLAASFFSAKTRPYGPVYGTISLIDASSGRQLAQYDEGQIDPTAEPIVFVDAGGKMAWSPNGKDILVVRREINIWRIG